MTGLAETEFEYLFVNYAGRAPLQTRLLDRLLCNDRWRLFQTMHYIKRYPTLREMRCMWGGSNAANLHKTIKRRVRMLYHRMFVVLKRSWANRHTSPNHAHRISTVTYEVRSMFVQFI